MARTKAGLIAGSFRIVILLALAANLSGCGLLRCGPEMYLKDE